MSISLNGYNPEATPNYATSADFNSLKDLIAKYQSNIDANYVKSNANGNAVVAGGINQYGFTRPDQVLMTGTDGKLLDPYKQTIGDSANALTEYANTRGEALDSKAKLGMGDSYGNLKGQANATGDMDSIKAMRQQANNSTIRDFDKAGTSANTAMANAQSQMAMRGGLGNGAAERMGKNMSNQAMMARQGIMSQNRDQNLNLDLQNANMKNDLLKSVGNVEQNNNQFNANAYTSAENQKIEALKGSANTEQSINAANVNTRKVDLQQMNMGAFAKFKEDMAAFGATQQADATRAAGSSSSGCFITTACVDVMGMDDDCWALSIARNFRDEYMSKTPDRAFELATYYKIAPVMLEQLKARGDHARILKRIFWNFITPFAESVNNGKLEEARSIYKSMMDYLTEQLKKERSAMDNLKKDKPFEIKG